MLVLAVVVAQGIKIAVKRSIGRPRPDEHLVNVLIGAHEKNGFPSGHTVHYVVFFGFLFFLSLVLIQRRRFRWPLLGLLGGLIVLIGLSRVYLGDHWASDVLAGYLLGGALLTAAICGYLAWTRRRSRLSARPVRTPSRQSARGAPQFWTRLTTGCYSNHGIEEGDPDEQGTRRHSGRGRHTG